MWAERTSTAHDPMVDLWIAVTTDAFAQWHRRAARDHSNGLVPTSEQWLMVKTLLEPETARYIEREAVKGAPVKRRSKCSAANPKHRAQTQRSRGHCVPA